MKKSFLLFLLILLFNFCATSGKVANEALHYALVGQNEKTIYKRLGVPPKNAQTTDGGKVLIYEFYSKGMYVTPNKSNITYETSVDPGRDRQG